MSLIMLEASTNAISGVFRIFKHELARVALPWDEKFIKSPI
jgi:hypothetical protein